MSDTNDLLQIALILAEQAPTTLPLLYVIWRLLRSMDAQQRLLTQLCEPCVKGQSDSADDQSTDRLDPRSQT